MISFRGLSAGTGKRSPAPDSFALGLAGEIGQGVEHDLRPGFKRFATRQQFGQRGESQLRNRLLSRSHRVVFQFDKMHHPEVDAAHFG